MGFLNSFRYGGRIHDTGYGIVMFIGLTLFNNSLEKCNYFVYGS